MKNVAFLLAAAALGGGSVWYGMSAKQNHDLQALMQQLAKGIKNPTVDPHSVGLHGLLHTNHAAMDAMSPTQLAKIKAMEAEMGAALFSTPGGLYTAADIAKNGTDAPGVRFAGMMPIHNLRPDKGEKLCPITKTKGNPSYAWWVGGKRYTFCCPPCIEEFVMRAKKDPRSILPPESYVQA